MPVADQQQLWHESAALASAMAEHFVADKMNIAALGNQVAQLHIHHVVRYIGDDAWPKPIWGTLPAKPYTEIQLKRRLEEVKSLLSQLHL